MQLCPRTVNATRLRWSRGSRTAQQKKKSMTLLLPVGETYGEQQRDITTNNNRCDVTIEGPCSGAMNLLVTASGSTMEVYRQTGCELGQGGPAAVASDTIATRPFLTSTSKSRWPERFVKLKKMGKDDNKRPPYC
ncbi:hypothetical protein EYF80_038732 [Liparis tanakae]|uniref:Uncharacterized protein n=1 Tax=Liparis tanakae TaxID=230148 RepID=A0A4Z2GCU5_9TELE|nr:hypothetical protein EYF80_038732 [Liparis tanakae]